VKEFQESTPFQKKKLRQVFKMMTTISFLTLEEEKYLKANMHMNILWKY
jgi:hypothetical protein